MLSVVINTLNEEKNIRDCIETVVWANEIIIVDMHSTDLTIEIAKKYTDKIYLHERVGYVEPARNFAITKSSGDWVFIIDADERVSPALRDEIIRLLQNPVSHAAFRVFFQEYIFGKKIKYGSWQHQRNIRLFRKQLCSWPDTIHTPPAINGSIGELQGAVDHYSHLTVGHFFRKINTYSDVEAQDWFKSGTRKGLFACFSESIGKFLKEYFYYQGFRDGGHGLIIATLMGIYYFSSRIKLWELWYKQDHRISIASTSD